jgi:hypothetical protein
VHRHTNLYQLSPGLVYSFFSYTTTNLQTRHQSLIDSGGFISILCTQQGVPVHFPTRKSCDLSLLLTLVTLASIHITLTNLIAPKVKLHSLINFVDIIKTAPSSQNWYGQYFCSRSTRLISNLELISSNGRRDANEFSATTWS